jgi:hypothetical protein
MTTSGNYGTNGHVRIWSKWPPTIYGKVSMTMEEIIKDHREFSSIAAEILLSYLLYYIQRTGTQKQVIGV